MEEVVNVSSVQQDQLRADFRFHKTNATIAGCCLCFVLMNLFVMVSNRTFAKAYRILIALNITNMIIILGIFGEAISLIHKYSSAINKGFMIVVNSRQCIQAYTLIQVYGDFAMPLIELTMGFERFTTVVLALPYCSRLDYNSNKFYVFAFLGAAIATAIPTTVSAVWPVSNVSPFCGRQAAFGIPFGVFNYTFNVVAIVTGLILNTATCFKAMKIQQSCGSVQKIKCYTSVAVVSTLLVSVPNFFSIIHATWFTMPDSLMTPAPILACINCALQFFINLGMNEEYRCRFARVFSCGKYKPIMSQSDDTNYTNTEKTKSIAKTLSIDTDVLMK